MLATSGLVRGFLSGRVVIFPNPPKATERAVGISTLGIHLHKGQNLCFWAEIKEVRTLRILNIRSLWLIKESGEKTITPRLPWSDILT